MVYASSPVVAASNRWRTASSSHHLVAWNAASAVWKVPAGLPGGWIVSVHGQKLPRKGAWHASSQGVHRPYASWRSPGWCRLGPGK